MRTRLFKNLIELGIGDGFTKANIHNRSKGGFENTENGSQEECNPGAWVCQRLLGGLMGPVVRGRSFFEKCLGKLVEVHKKIGAMLCFLDRRGKGKVGQPRDQPTAMAEVGEFREFKICF